MRSLRSVFIRTEIRTNYHKNFRPTETRFEREIEGNSKMVYFVSLVSVWASFRGNILEAGNADTGFHVSNPQGSLFYLFSFPAFILFFLFFSHRNYDLLKSRVLSAAIFEVNIMSADIDDTFIGFS